MTLYQYSARTNKGELIQAESDAHSLDQLADHLRSQGLFPVKIHLSKKKSLDQLQKSFMQQPVPADVLNRFARDMYTLIHSGLSLPTAVQNLSQEHPIPAFSAILREILQQLNAGLNFSSAMKQHPKVFSPMMVSMIEVGESTGELGQAFLRLCDYMEIEGQVNKEVKSALRYPSFVVATIIIAIFVITNWVMPSFSRLFDSAKVPLPIATRLLIGLSSLVHEHCILLIFSAIGLLYLYRKIFAKPEYRYHLDKLLLKLPIVGALSRHAILLRFARSFCIVLDTGVPIIKGLELAADTATNLYAKRAILQMISSIEKGFTLSQAATDSQLFYSLDLHMMRANEQAGDLRPMLKDMAEHYQREITYDIKRMKDWIEPALVSVLTFVVLLLALAVYLPIWNMMSLTHGG